MATPTDKRDALERMRKSSRVRTLLAAFGIGCLVGAGVAQVLAAIAANPPGAPDSSPPAILAVDPPEGSFLVAGNASLRVTFDERLAAPPVPTFSGAGNGTVDTEAFDGRTWRGRIAIHAGDEGDGVLRLAGISDLVGNSAGGVDVRYRVDAVAPTATASSALNATTGPFDVAWDASDGAGSGVARVELWARMDGAWSVLTAKDDARGSHRVDLGARRALVDLAAVAVDRAGNRQAGPVPQARVLYNAIPPSAALALAPSYWFRAPADLAAVATANTTGAELRYYFAPDNATWQGPFSAGTSASLAWAFAFPVGIGHYRLYARGQNAFGDVEPDQASDATELAIGFDDAVPSSRLQPLAGYWHASPVEVTAEAADAGSGIARLDLLYAFRPNASAAWSAWAVAGGRADPPWILPFDFPRGDGRYELTTRAADLAGNVEGTPPPGSAELALGLDRDAPPAPDLRQPDYIDAATRRTNLTWSASPPGDVVRFEIHRGASATFAPDPSPCETSTTCVLETARDDRTAWVPVATENATSWFRVVAVDEGGLNAASEAFGANFHGLGFDTPGTFALAAGLPVGIAWSERLQYASSCVDCADVFKVSLAAGDTLSLTVAVPSTGDFRLVVYDAAIQVLATSQRSGFGVWESLAVTAPMSGVYYVVVDWSNVFGPGNQNYGWYTLSASIA